MSIPAINSSFAPTANVASNHFTFVVEGQEIQIETRFLLQCDYFNNMLSHGVSETLNRRIQIENASKETVQAFLNFLKTYQLPNLTPAQVIELYMLVHQYQHIALLNQVRPLVVQQIPSQCSHVLQLACVYEDDQLKKACRDHLERNAYNEQQFLFRLVDEELYAVIEEVLSWMPANREGRGSSNMSGMLSYNSNGKTTFAKLISKQKYELASKTLAAGQANGVRTNQIVSNPQELILQMLNGQAEPTKEQNDLIVALAADNPSVFTSNYNIENPPIFVALIRGWDQTVRCMLQICKSSVIRTTNNKGTGLLAIAIEHCRIASIEALKTNGKINSSEFSDYVLLAVNTQSLQLVKAIVSFPLDQNYSSSNPQVQVKCIEAAIDTKDLEILREVWPYFQGNKHEIDRLRKKVFEEDRLDLAEIMFSGDFDASKEVFPEDGKRGTSPWLHQTVLKKGAAWVEFMATRSRDKDVTVNYRLDKASPPVPMTPLLLALKYKKKPDVIRKMLELGFDINTGNSSFYPIHLVLEYNDAAFTKLVLSYDPDLTVVNDKKENFLHLLLKGKQFLDRKDPTNVMSNTTVLEQQDHEGNTPFHLALERLKFFEKLDETLSSQTNIASLRLVYLDDSYRILSSNTAVLWKTNRSDKAPLQILSSSLFETVMKYYIDQIQKTENERLARSLLLWSGQKYLYQICAKLIPLAGDIKTVCSSDGRSLLHYAAAVGAAKAVQKLIDSGIPKDSVDNNGSTALHFAVKGRHKALVEQLLKSDADAQKMDDSGDTPLSLALKLQNRTQQDQEIIDLLETSSCVVQ
ncbi:MAG: ankyrin repeat domain-containing protein [Rhabdochlamydiaceae bacterium]|nr:ankyrin repeat domain-containing protein [Rhabdochlamydiaceae bacterium]